MLLALLVAPLIDALLVLLLLSVASSWGYSSKPTQSSRSGSHGHNLACAALLLVLRRHLNRRGITRHF